VDTDCFYTTIQTWAYYSEHQCSILLYHQCLILCTLQATIPKESASTHTCNLKTESGTACTFEAAVPHLTFKHRVRYWNMNIWGFKTTDISFISHSQLKKQGTITCNIILNNCDKQLKRLNNSRTQQCAANQRKLREILCSNYCVTAWSLRLCGLNPAMDRHYFILNTRAARPLNTGHVTCDYGNSQIINQFYTLYTCKLITATGLKPNRS
jgi:hypothetical protein